MKRFPAIVALMVSMATPSLFAQAKIGIVDFERAVAESAEGKKASEKFGVTLNERQALAQKKQKEVEDAQNKLRTQERALSDAAKLELNRTIETKTLELQRYNEDAERDLGSLRDQLLRPIAEKAQVILNAFANELGVTLLIDVSNPQNGVVWAAPGIDITDALIKRIDAAAAKSTPEKK